MGQENEQHAELVATIQHDHVKMKSWYNTHADAKSFLHSQYGSTYPAFWREVVNWNGWKETRKTYLKSIEGKLTNTNTSTTATTDPSSTAVPRKRKSRWASTSTTAASDHASAPKRKSRWARGRDPTPVRPMGTVLDILPGLPANLTSAEQSKLTSLQSTLKECNAKLSNLETEAARIDALPIGHADRSPSPPPVYGPDGKRKNTRAIRWRERFSNLRQDTLEQILRLTTSGKGSSAMQSVAPSLFNRKRTKKIYIPVEDHPTYNFIGLIIGPRGKTQKEMEGKTGCKIAIRGKGSVKEGARGRRDGKIMEGDNEPLHVVITGDNQENVDKAGQMVTDMLVVIDDDKNVHKQQQLRELALLNGTLKEDEYCSLCAEKGHRAFECPKRFSINGANKAEVKCAICGDTSHPTRDCKMKKDGPMAEKDAKELDSDYFAFMNELDGKPANSAPDSVAVAPRTSLVTTIIDGKPVAPVCMPVIPKDPVPAVTAVKSNLPSTATGGSSLITTISSRVVKTSTATPDATLGGTTANVAPSLPNASTITSTAAVPPLPPPPTPATTLTNASQGVAPPPTIPSAAGSSPSAVRPPLPPPPPYGNPPPHHSQQQAGYQSYRQPHHHQQQQQQYNRHHQQQQQQYGYNGYHQQGGAGGQGGYQQQGYHQQGGYHGQLYNNGQQGNGAAAGWDYTSYYGNNDNSGNGSGGGGGAGGFNWWD